MNPIATKIQQEAKERLKSLKEYSARRREWYQDVNIRIADKQIEHLVSLSAISAAIIALTIAFKIQKNLWVELSFWALIATVILGTLLALLLMFYNKKVLDYTRKIELLTIDNLKKSTNDVIKNPELYKKHQEDFAQESKKIEELPEVYAVERKILEYLYYLVLILFALGILGLVGTWITQNSYAIETTRIVQISTQHATIGEQVYMNINLIIMGALVLISLILGFIKYSTLGTRGWIWQRKFAEIWNCSVNFLLAGLVGFYFVLIRWPKLEKGEALSLADFAIFAIFAMGLFGHLNVLSLNVTEGIKAILDRVLRR